jgi:hypothetical protein
MDNKDYFETPKGTFCTRFPLIRESIIQKDLKEVLRLSSICHTLWTRRGGKTTELAVNWFERILLDGDTMKNKRRYICSHPATGEIYSKFVTDWFMQAFGGKDNFKAPLDEIWIPLPEKFIDYIFTEDGSFNKNMPQSDIEWFLGIKDKIPILDNVDGIWYVKLFKHNIGEQPSKKKEERIYVGTLFNGAEIHLVGANYFFDKYVSGGDVFGLWGEELGTWAKDYITGIALPAIIAKGGFVQTSLTPPKDELGKDVADAKEHWTYKSIVEPLIAGVEEGYVKHKKVHGVNYYVTKTSISYDEEVNGKIKNTVKDDYTVVSIAKFSECFQYTHWGVKGFVDVISKVQNDIKVEMKKDENDNPVKDKEGYIQYNVEFTNKVIPTRATKLITYMREYECSFEGEHKNRVFEEFGNHNVVPKGLRDWSLYPQLFCFDKGMSGDKESTGRINLIKSKGNSHSAWVKMAYLGNNQWVVFDEGFELFEYKNIATLFLENLKEGRPVVYESKMNDRRAFNINSYGDADSDMYQICKAEPKLNLNYNSGVYHHGLMPCHKRQNDEKIAEFNELYFKPDNNTINKVPNLLTGEDFGGCRIYFTDNCTNSYDFFTRWAYKENKGVYTRPKVQEDLWDCISYGVDTYNLNTTRKAAIDLFWKNRHNVNKPRKLANPFMSRQGVTINQMLGRLR